VARTWKTKRSATAAKSGEYNKTVYDEYSDGDDGDWFFDVKIGICQILQEAAAKQSLFCVQRLHFREAITRYCKEVSV
jgi:hypothetical protein